MGLDIAELMMDVEDHLGIELHEDAAIPRRPPTVSNIAKMIGEVASKSGKSYSIDYITGFLIGMIYRSEGKRLRAILTPETDLVKDLNYG